jgi:hypothetical protein
MNKEVLKNLKGPLQDGGRAKLAENLCSFPFRDLLNETPLSARLISMDSSFNEHFAWNGDQGYKVVP